MYNYNKWVAVMEEIHITDSYISKRLSFERFANLQQKIEFGEDNEILLMLDIKERLGLTFVFLFSTLPFFAKKHNKKIKVMMNEKTFILFKKIGFFENEVYITDFDYSDMIVRDSNRISQDIDVFKTVTEITKEAPVIMSDALSSLFISKAGEMYNNAIEHSGGEVFGAKFFKYQKNTYCFSCYDNGIGIPQKVKNLKTEIVSDVDAFNWAMKRGNSTVMDGIPRGLGLDLLNSFVKANDGRIRICTGNVLYNFNSKGGHIEELNSVFKGTLFEMDIIADNDHKYILT